MTIYKEEETETGKLFLCFKYNGAELIIIEGHSSMNGSKIHGPFEISGDIECFIGLFRGVIVK